MFSQTSTVSLRLEKALGSTRIWTLAGVVPEEGLTETPDTVPLMAKSRLPPLASPIQTVCEVALRWQKLDWKNNS